MSIPKLWVALFVATLATLTSVDAANKRLPSGFQGMRGKKSIDYPNGNDNFMENDADKLAYLSSIHDNSIFLNPQNIDPTFFSRAQAAIAASKRGSMGFQGMRGKKNSLMDTGPLYHYGLQNDDLLFDAGEYLEKRAPMGFQGMRGKRQFEFPAYGYQEKRAPKGFQGMRGKKDVQLSDEYLQAFDESTHNNEDERTNPEQHPNVQSLGFSNELDSDNHGSLYNSGDNIINIDQKQRRSPGLGFYGTRGKKLPSTSTFFGMRGKKGPFDFPFRGKFVGVRGKKMSQETPEDLQQLAERLSWGGDSFEKRKGPSGFVGMRGKKWSVADADGTTLDGMSHTAVEN